MQRWCSKLRSIAALRPTTTMPLPHSHCLLHYSPNLLHKSFTLTVIASNINPVFNAPSTAQLALSNHAPSLPLSLIQVRHLTLKQRKRKLKSRRPATPVVSKVKKIKMKSYSSYKGRFRVMKDGQIRRWKEGKRHNAHLKFDLSLRYSQLLMFIHFVIAPPEPIIGYASSSCSLRGLNSVLFTTEISASGNLLGLTCDAKKPHVHS